MKNISILNKRSFWTAIFLSTLFFTACEKTETELGLNLQDDTLFTSADTLLQISAQMIRVDSLKTDSLTSNILGNYIDPDFGYTSADLGFNLELSSSSVDFGVASDIIVDSIILSMRFTGYTYGKTVDQKFSVKKIISDFSPDSTYYSNYKPELSAEEYVLDPEESYELDFSSLVEIGNEIFDPQIRININPSLGTDLIGTGAWNDQEEFLESFEGLYIESTTEDGGIVGYDIKDFDSRLTMYYHNPITEDTTLYIYNVDESSATLSNFEHNYTGWISSFNNPEVDSLDASSYLYIQSAASIEGQVSLPDVSDILENDVSINKAELVVPVYSSNNSRYAPPPNMLVVLRNDDGDLEFLPDEGALTFYSSSNNEYRFDISRFIQGISSGNYDNQDLFLVALSSGIAANRVILKGPLYNASDISQNMRLELTFSK